MKTALFASRRPKVPGLTVVPEKCLAWFVQLHSFAYQHSLSGFSLNDSSSLFWKTHFYARYRFLGLCSNCLKLNYVGNAFQHNLG
ncbi:TPA: hypothetical protein HA244_06505 [Candidatus Micrarchaeota archaeon]|nr:hypothetical protein [Candidatus Micrarchaeota archaeon]